MFQKQLKTFIRNLEKSNVISYITDYMSNWNSYTTY